MATTTKGAQAIIHLFAGTGSINAFNQTNARICVGDGSTAFAISQTDLTGTNKTRKGLDSAPVVTTATASADYTSTFGLSEGNHAWNEIGLANSASGDYLATRRLLSGFGTKPNTESWTVTLTVVATPA
jgi:hypothetical protein